jgi:glycosyltransferase involved in cell wall biosynthesis
MSTDIDLSAPDTDRQGIRQAPPAGPALLAVVMKGYPRLSETFIAQELLALQNLGLDFEIWSLRRPTDGAVHMMHRQITAPLRYLPEYLYEEPWRVLRSIAAALVKLRFRALLKVFFADLRRDPTANRLRRFGQACVMAWELPARIRHVHVHYLHTPASVVRYAAILRGLTWSFSAHAKDIWTTPDWEKAEKIADAAWGVTCTRDGLAELARLSDRADAVRLVYHGLDFARFPEAPTDRRPHDGRTQDTAVELVTIGRAVEKKGFDDLIAALALLPAERSWHLTHIGGGEHLARLKQQAGAAGLSTRISWLGAQTQAVVIEKLRAADIFVLPSKEAASGDRDGLPNVVMEAASQALPIIATDFAGIPEFVRHDVEGLLCPPSDIAALSARLEQLITGPALRHRLGQAALLRLRTSFSAQGGVGQVHAALLASLAQGKATAP